MNPDKTEGTLPFIWCRVQLLLVLVFLLSVGPALAADVTAPVTSAYPGAGSYQGARDVSLYCFDGDTGCNSTYYCLGSGCTPTTTFTSSLQITSSSELSFYSRDKSGNAEDLQTVSYRIDQTPPVTVANPPGGSYPSAPFVALSCSDATGTGCTNTYYCLGDNCAPTTYYSAPIPINDSTVLRFYSRDSGNNIEAVVTQSYLRPGAPKTITVPGMQPDIQAAIEGAYNGDTVLVAPGTYRENLNFLGKLLTVTSSGGPEVTIIDGSQAGPVAIFNSGETLSAILKGFTLQHGSGMGGSGDGGGIYIYNAAPTVTNNIISGNTAGWGGGIYIGFGAPAIRNNLITKNSATQGGGISIFGAGSDAEVTGNTISENLSYNGAGLSLWAAGRVLVKGNVIKNNSASSQGGGAFNVNSSQTSLVQNLVVNNKALAGGAVYSGSSYDSFINNTLVNNDSPQDASCYLDRSGCRPGARRGDQRAGDRQQ